MNIVTPIRVRNCISSSFQESIAAADMMKLFSVFFYRLSRSNYFSCSQPVHCISFCDHVLLDYGHQTNVPVSFITTNKDPTSMLTDDLNTVRSGIFFVILNPDTRNQKSFNTDPDSTAKERNMTSTTRRDQKFTSTQKNQQLNHPPTDQIFYPFCKCTFPRNHV